MLLSSPDERFDRWKGGGCAAVKVGPVDLDDVLLIRQDGDRPFQAVKQSFLGGNTSPTLLHAGVPGSTETGNHWVTSQELVQNMHDRSQEF